MHPDCPACHPLAGDSMVFSRLMSMLFSKEVHSIVRKGSSK